MRRKAADVAWIGRDAQSFLQLFQRQYELSDEDISALKALGQFIRVYPDKHIFKHYGEKEPDAVLLIDGIAARVRISRDGSRHILGFLVRGEMSVSRSAETAANYELVSVGSCIALVLPKKTLALLEERHSNIRRILEVNAQREIRALQEKLVSVSRASVERRLVYLLEDIYSRLEAVDKASDRSMSLPLKQNDIADAIGASLVQVSKSLSKLRRDGRLELEFSQSETSYSLSDRHMDGY